VNLDKTQCHYAVLRTIVPLLLSRRSIETYVCNVLSAKGKSSVFFAVLEDAHKSNFNYNVIFE